MVAEFFFSLGAAGKVWLTSRRDGFPPADTSHCAAAARLASVAHNLSRGRSNTVGQPAWQDMTAALVAHAGNANAAPLRTALLSKCLNVSSSERPIFRIGVVGGSMTAGSMNCHAISGVMCRGQFSRRELSWSNQLQKRLAPVLPACDLHVVLLATAANRIDIMLDAEQRGKLSREDDDMLIEDFTVNDNKALDNFTLPRVQAGMETLLRHALARQKPPQVIHLDTWPPLASCEEALLHDPVHEPIANHYAVPVLSFRRALCGRPGTITSREGARAAWDAAWLAGCGKLNAPMNYSHSSCGVHPGSDTHEMVAHLLAYYIVRQAAIAAELACTGRDHSTGNDADADHGEGLSAVRPKQAEPQQLARRWARLGVAAEAAAVTADIEPWLPRWQLDRLQGCAKPLTSVDWTTPTCCGEGACPGLVRRAGGWRCYADRIDKPTGFIATDAGATAEFSVRMSRLGRVVLSYLRSYEGMGRVRLALNGQYDSENATTLDGRWESTTSQTHATVLMNADLPGGEKLSLSARYPSEVRLGLRFEGGGPEAKAKFKLLSLQTC